MAYQTEIRRVHSARKAHICGWCGTRIQAGDGYIYYRYFGDDAAGTVKEHPECYSAMMDTTFEVGETFMSGDNPRGCNCGHSAGCERCEGNRHTSWYKKLESRREYK